MLPIMPLVLLTLEEHLPCLRVIRCPAIPPVDFCIFQNSIRIGEVVWKRRRRRLLRGHPLDVGSSHDVSRSVVIWIALWGERKKIRDLKF